MMERRKTEKRQNQLLTNSRVGYLTIYHHGTTLATDLPNKMLADINSKVTSHKSLSLNLTISLPEKYRLLICIASK